MDFFKEFTYPKRGNILSASLLAITFLFFSFSQSGAAGLEKTLFLPLKVTSFSEDTTLEEKADEALSLSLLREGIDLMERGEAEKLLNYKGEWPPPAPVLNKVEKLKGYTYLVFGSLTEIGGQISLDMKLIDPLSPSESIYFAEKADSIAEIEPLSEKLLKKIAASTSRETVIASISPAGNRKIDSGAILKNILTKPGDPYDSAALRNDLKSIFKMGYFDDIQIEVSQGPEGKIVTFKVVEKPVIRSIIYAGTDELDEEKVKEVVTIKEQDILNLAKINKDIEAIELLYKSKGYYNTKVNSEINYPTDESVELRFEIEEGEKIYIKKIAFEGNVTFDDDELEDEIETNTKGWFSWITSSGLLDYDKLNQDAGRILNFYGNNGFLETKIGDPIVTQENEWLFITFTIEEGPRFKVGSVDLEGDLLDEKENLLAELSITEEEYISRKILREDILKITDIYAEKGYANASIRPLINKSAEEDTIDISIKINKGDLVYINRINIVGNTHTRDNVIRRELKVEEGGVFNAKALRDSMKKLQYLDFFEEVNITPEKSFDDSTVDLIVDVKDKNTGEFGIGAGYSSVDHLILMGEIVEKNFLGRGDTLALSADIGGESNKYKLKYRNPRLNDSMLSWGAELFDTKREFDDYTKDSKGGTLSFGYPVFERWRGFGAYSYTDTDLSDVQEDASFIIRNSQDIKITSSVKFTLQRDSRDMSFLATEGSKHLFSVKYAGGPFGGDSEFTKVEGTTSWYFPLFWDTVFHFKGSAGQAFEHENGGLPVYERFFLGGLRSIRGFKGGKVSPRDPDTDERIGGDKMWFTNLEYIFPLFSEQGLNGVVFYDVGNVLDDSDDWNVDDFEQAVGAGIRWRSPLGALRLEWGYNLDPEEDEDDFAWNFSIGSVF